MTNNIMVIWLDFNENEDSYLKEKEKCVKNPFDYTENLAIYVEDIDNLLQELTERKED